MINKELTKIVADDDSQERRAKVSIHYSSSRTDGYRVVRLSVLAFSTNILFSLIVSSSIVLAFSKMTS